MNSIDRQIESIMHSYAVGPRSGYRQNQKIASDQVAILEIGITKNIIMMTGQ